MALFDGGSLAFQGPTSVTTSAVRVWTADTSALSALSPAVTLRHIVVQNAGTASMYVGAASVTTSTGQIVPAGGALQIQGLNIVTGTTTYDVYAITAAGTTTVYAGLATNSWTV